MRFKIEALENRIVLDAEGADSFSGEELAYVLETLDSSDFEHNTQNGTDNLIEAAVAYERDEQFKQLTEETLEMQREDHIAYKNTLDMIDGNLMTVIEKYEVQENTEAQVVPVGDLHVFDNATEGAFIAALMVKGLASEKPATNFLFEYKNGKRASISEDKRFQIEKNVILVAHNHLQSIDTTDQYMITALDKEGHSICQNSLSIQTVASSGIVYSESPEENHILAAQSLRHVKSKGILKS